MAVGGHRRQYIKMQIAPEGMSVSKNVGGLMGGNPMRFDGGLIYDAAGQVSDPEAERLIGTFYLKRDPAPLLMVPDADHGRVYFLIAPTPLLDDHVARTWKLHVFDSGTFLKSIQ